MAISLISTVKDEASSIGRFLDSILLQTQQPDEIVLVDGGSSDGTVEVILSYSSLPIRLIVEPCNIARGRNLAITAAKFEFIAITDAGCQLHPQWLARLQQEIETADIAVGNYRPVIRSLFDACQYSLAGLFKSERNLTRFCISSRSLALQKRVWKETGGYPEWLNYSEDMYFHTQFLQRSYVVRFVPEAIVEWEQRSSVGAVYRQYFRYMEGDGIARMHTRRHVLRFGTYLGGFTLALLSFFQPLALIPLILGAALYLSVPFSSFVRLNKYSLASPAIFIIPALLLVMDVAKMSGYLSGLLLSSKLRPVRLPQTPNP